MEKGPLHTRSTKLTYRNPAGAHNSGVVCRSVERAEEKMGDVTMQEEARSGQMNAVVAHPLAELLECPPAASNLLNGSAQGLEFDTGETVFHQNEICKGLYVVVSGLFQRKAERLKTRLTLGPARAGDLVELAATLGDGLHTYTLTAQTPGSMLILPIATLSAVFEKYPPLRMHLLEELAREVSRAYISCCLSRAIHTRHRISGAAIA
jgi:hypothetical protein